MRVLAEDKKIEVLKLILEGCSIRTAERITGVHRDTITRLIVSTGNQCVALHDALFRSVPVRRIEFDELWSYVGIKQKNLPVVYQGRNLVGDQYLFIAFDPDSKAVLSYRVGRRDGDNADMFLRDLRDRVTGNYQMHSDKFNPYEGLVGKIFGANCNYGQIVKNYDRRGKIKSVTSRTVYGQPSAISTTAVERNNLTLRMGIRRLARKTNAFSKKFENHQAAIALFIAYYNLCRLHAVAKKTPAMMAGLMEEPWTIKDLFNFRIERAAA